MKENTDQVRVSVVIPAYNEELGIGEVVRGLQAAISSAGLKPGDDFEILVIDDGSTDKTASAAQAAGAQVLSHPANGGYGRALLTGFDAARFRWVMMIDADDSYDPQDAAKLIRFAPDFDMIVGARQGSLFWGNPIQTFLRWIYLRLASFVAGESIPDANSGMRLIHKDALDKNMPVLCYGYSLSTTMTLSFIQGGKFVTFVPIAYKARKGSSKVRGFRDIPRTLQIMVQVILFYNPLKFAVILALFPGLAAIFFLLRYAAGYPGHPALFSLSLLGALAAFLCGCLLESIRLHGLGRR